MINRYLNLLLDAQYEGVKALVASQAPAVQKLVIETYSRTVCDVLADFATAVDLLRDKALPLLKDYPEEADYVTRYLTYVETGVIPPPMSPAVVQGTGT